MIVKPLLLFKDTAREIGKGDLSKRINIKSNDEIGELSNAFNQMTLNLEQSKLKIQEYRTGDKGDERKLINLFYDLALYRENSNERSLKDYYTWTACSASSGELVSFGNCGVRGADVNVFRPYNRYDYLGFCFSRS